MHHVPLKVLEGDFPMDYKIILADVIRRPLDPKSGIGMDEMRRGVRVLDALDSANGTLDLEDADYEHLLEKLRVMQWNVVDRRILTLVEDVEGADAR